MHPIRIRMRKRYPLSKEEWKDIEGFPGYQVSNQGRLRSNKRSHKNNGDYYFLKPRLLPNGYYQVSLYRSDGAPKEISVHTLVANAFNDHSDPSKNVVMHMNDIKTDNRASNLKFGTQSENIRMAVERGHFAENFAKSHEASCVKIVAHNTMTGETINFNSASEAARYFGRTVSFIFYRLHSPKICMGRKDGWTFQEAV